MKQMTNQEAHEYLAKMRWGNKPICPYCECKKVYKRSKEKALKCIRYKCQGCNSSFSALTKTIFHGMKADMSKSIDLMQRMQIDREWNVHRSAQRTEMKWETVKRQMLKIKQILPNMARFAPVGRPETDFPAYFSWNKSMRDHLANNPQ